MRLFHLLRKAYRTPVIQRTICLIRKEIGKYRKPIKIFDHHKFRFQNRSAIEIGGPTRLFEDENKVFPIYSLLSRIDNCNYNENNFWSQLKEGESINFNNQETNGKHIVADASNLYKIDNSSYDIFINSHVIEHIANPIKALNEWKRVIKEKGLLVMVVPHKDCTYDNRRPVTKLEHIIEDFRNNIGEDDSSHFEEVLNLHDLERDSTVKDYSEHQERTLDNFHRRIVHHHVFDTELVVKILDYVNFRILDIQQVKPYHIIVIAQNENETLSVDNSYFLDKTSRIYSRSCFPSDRVGKML